MISMYRKKIVLNYHIVYGYGAKAIITAMQKEGQTPPARNTIRKYINNYERLLTTKGLEAATAYMNRKDAFKTPERKCTKLDLQARKYIEDWLETNRKRRQTGNAKQCIEMREVHRLLVEEMGYDVSYPSITAYAREYVLKQEGAKNSGSREAFIRQFHPAGEECQFDWGDVKLVIGGKKMTVRMAAFVLPHSNHRRGYLFIREHTLAFQESHRNYFRDIGHIPLRMVYDNMKVAVKSFVGEKEPTDALLDMSSFYGFQWRFCNARRGNEKGNVEETVKVLRKAAFSVRMEFDTLEEAQAYLDKVCERLNITPQSEATQDIVRLAQEDFDAMRPWKDDFACFQLFNRHVNNYSTICVEKAHYSVPDRLSMREVTVRNHTNKIEVIENGKVIAKHEKVADGQWSIKLEHYLTTLSHKPGALKNAEALRQAPEELQRLFRNCFMNTPKDFVELLIYARDKGKTYEDITEAYDSLRGKNVKHVDLALMKSTLMAEQCKENVQAVILVQNAKDIETQADAGTTALMCIMNGQTTFIQTYGS